MTTLYSYYRSSAAYRVRIAMNLKGVAHELVAVNLAKGAQREAGHAAVNPQMRVPVLVLDSGDTLLQSQAILEWLEETHPEPALLPKDPVARAKIRAVMSIICCDVHPIHNSGTLAELRRQFGANDDQVNAWIAHWMGEGFRAIEKLIHPAPFAFGASPTFADLCLVPQLYGARRFSVPLDAYPRILAAEAAMLKLPAVARAAPDAQPDAPSFTVS